MLQNKTNTAIIMMMIMIIMTMQYSSKTNRKLLTLQLLPIKFNREYKMKIPLGRPRQHSENNSKQKLLHYY